MTELPHDHGQNSDKYHNIVVNTASFQKIADMFKLLGDVSRVRIFWLLCHCEECVTNISVLTDMTNPAVSHHLKQLRMNGLITGRRDGKEIYYSATNTPIASHLHHMIEQTMHIMCPKSENEEEIKK